MYHPPFFVCTPVFLLESFPTGCGPNSSEENALQCSILTTVLLYAEPRLDYYFPFASSEFISFAFHCTKMTPHKALNSQSWTKNHLNWFQKSLLMIPTFSTKCIWMGNPAKYISQLEMFLLITSMSSRFSDSWPLKPRTFWTFGMRRAI